MNMKSIPPGTIAAIAASLMAQGEALAADSDIFSRFGYGYRDKRINQFVMLARDIAAETIRQESNQ